MNRFAYLDDVIILGRTFEEHLTNLKAVFSTSSMKQAWNSAKGVATDPAKTDKVADWPVPRYQHEVQQFLGLATITADLFTISPRLQNPFITCLMEKTALFQWSTQRQDTFKNLKHRLVSASILTCSALDTDASDSGIGAVFFQIQEDCTERVIAYASQALSKLKCQYCMT